MVFFPRGEGRRGEGRRRERGEGEREGREVSIEGRGEKEKVGEERGKEKEGRRGGRNSFFLLKVFISRGGGLMGEGERKGEPLFFEVFFK